MATIEISEDEVNDFLDEQPTEPRMARTLDSFMARANELGYGQVREWPVGEGVPLHWADRLNMELSSAVPVDLGPGWAGRVAR